MHLKKVMSLGHKRQIVEQLVAVDVVQAERPVVTLGCAEAPLPIRPRCPMPGWLA
jgi:hypothetical protein